MRRRFSLVELVDRAPVAEAALADGSVTWVGRGAECALRPSTRIISKIHFEISISGRDARLRDLRSTSGTWLNERRALEGARLQDGDRIRAGDAIFEFRCEPSAALYRGALVDEAAEEIFPLFQGRYRASAAKGASRATARVSVTDETVVEERAVDLDRADQDRDELVIDACADGVYAIRGDARAPIRSGPHLEVGSRVLRFCPAKPDVQPFEGSPRASLGPLDVIDRGELRCDPLSLTTMLSYLVFPLERAGTLLCVAAATPAYAHLVDDLERRTGLKVEIRRASTLDILDAIVHFRGAVPMVGTNEMEHP